jgi:hypothetical protein
MLNFKIAFLFGLLSLTSYVSTIPRVSLNGSGYKVVEYSTNKLTSLSEQLKKSHIIKFEDQTVSVGGVCNSCSYNADYSGNHKVKFTRGMCTRIACTEVPSMLDSEIDDVLENANLIKVIGKYLYISESNNKRIKAVRVDN